MAGETHLEVKLAELTVLVTEHTKRDQERWETSRLEHKEIWEAMREAAKNESQKREAIWQVINDSRTGVGQLQVKDRVMSAVMNGILVIAASSASGFIVWMISR